MTGRFASAAAAAAHTPVDRPPPLAASVAAAWEGFWFAAADARPLAAVRIGTAAIALVLWWSFVPDVAAWFDPAGLLPLDARKIRKIIVTGPGGVITPNCGGGSGCVSGYGRRHIIGELRQQFGPTVAEYQSAMGIVNKDGAAIYKYLNFDQIEEYAENAGSVAA